MIDLSPSAIKGDTLDYPSQGAIFGVAIPWMASAPSYTDLPRYWSPRRDWVLSNTPHKEDMWASAVAIATTKFASHGFTLKDSQDSQRRVSASQELLKRADGGQGWVTFAQKVMRDLLTTDNGVFIAIRRDGDSVQKIRVKAQTIQGAEMQSFAESAVTVSRPGAKISGLYHLDSLRCIRTGNLAYPLRYYPINGVQQILRWDQVLMYADQPSPRAELFGVGECAASRAYKTIAKLGAMEQLVYENLTGGGANKLVFLQGINDPTLKAILDSGKADAQARGLVYYLGTILGAIPSDTPISSVEIRLKELLTSFVPKDERDNGYLIYANAIGVPVQSIQPLSGQGLGTGTQTVVLDDQASGQGALPAFLKWWEQTVSDRVLPKTTELTFTDENDLRDQKLRAEVQKLRADTRAVQIGDGEISPAMARQIAVDSEDLPEELVGSDATSGGSISDDEKGQIAHALSPAALALIQGAPTQAPAKQQPGLATATKDAGNTGVMVALYPDAAAAKQLAALAGVTEPLEQLHLTLAFLGDSSETALATNKAKVVEAVKQWAAAKGVALKGTINGLGRFFHSEDDGTNAVYVSPDVPGLPETRQSLVDWIEQSGFDYAQNHGFTPHITVAYVPLNAPTPAIRIETPVTFDHVTLAWGDEQFDYPLGAGVATKDAAEDDAAALMDEEMGWAKRLGREARKHGRD